MSLSELKAKLTKDLKELGDKLDQFQKMQIAINLKIALATVSRYTSGFESEVRRLDLAESIIKEGDTLLNQSSEPVKATA